VCLNCSTVLQASISQSGPNAATAVDESLQEQFVPVLGILDLQGEFLRCYMQRMDLFRFTNENMALQFNKLTAQKSKTDEYMALHFKTIEDNFEPINKKLDVLIASNPHACLLSMNIPVMEKHTLEQTKTTRNGAISRSKIP
jgi:hypothetical protein